MILNMTIVVVLLLIVTFESFHYVTNLLLIILAIVIMLVLILQCKIFQKVAKAFVLIGEVNFVEFLMRDVIRSLEPFILLEYVWF